MPGPARSPSFWLKCMLAACLGSVLVIAFIGPTANARPQTFTIPVNSTLDEPLVLPPTGLCVSTPSGKCTVRAAIMLANRITVNPVTINVPSGTYTLAIPALGADADESGDLNITGTVPIALAGAGAGSTIIDANQIDRVFSLGPGVAATLSGLTVRNGSAVDGGGILNQGTLALNNSRVSGNFASTGSFGGGGILNQGSVTLNNSTVLQNFTSSGFGGGGITNLGTATLNNSIVSSNFNSSSGSGGGILNTNTATLTLNNSTVSDNFTSSGGSGGGIFNFGTLTLNNSTLSRNLTFGGGGGILNNFTATLNNSTLNGNAAGSYGGGIFNQGTATLNNSTVSGNTATSSGSGFGGGVSNLRGYFTLASSTVSSNTAAYAGGGIWTFACNACANALVVVNSTISGNRANTDGGGILASDSADVRLYNANIAFNRADADQNGSGSGGGVNSLNSTVQLSNTLLADNTGTPNCIITCFPTSDDCKGTLNSGGYNLIRTTSGCTINKDDSTNLKGVDPLLGPLAANGGPTLTHALLRGSPAIDAGSRFLNVVSNCSDDSGHLLTTDQRGWARPYPAGGRCDIGAYERGAFLFLPLIVR